MRWNKFYFGGCAIDSVGVILDVVPENRKGAPIDPAAAVLKMDAAVVGAWYVNPPVSFPDVSGDGFELGLELKIEPKLNNGGAFGEPNGKICGALALALSAGVD